MHDPFQVDAEIINNMKARLAQEARLPAAVKVLYKDWMDDSVHLVRLDRTDDEASEVSQA